MRIAILNPYPLHRAAVGGVTRVYGLARFLAERHEVDVVALSSGDDRVDAAAVEEFARFGVRQQLFPKPRPRLPEKLIWMAGPQPYVACSIRSPELEGALLQLARGTALDLVHVEFSYLAPWLAPLGAETARVLAEQECQSLYLERLNHVPFRERSWFERYVTSEAGKVRRFEAEVLPRFDRVFAITPVEQSRMARYVERVELHPHVVCSRQFTPPPGEPEGGPLLFVGNFAHGANLHSLSWFLDLVWPAIRATRPAARLEVVGPALGAARCRRVERAGAHVVGYVADLPARYQSASVVINPIVSGGGMRGKVLEAFACGRPVVSTSSGMEGIAAVPGVHFQLACDPGAFAAAVSRYLSDPVLRQAHGRAARDLVVQRYDRGVVFAALETAYASIVEERRRRRREP